MSGLVGTTLVAVAGLGPLAYQRLRVRRRARAAWLDVELDARAHRRLAPGPTALRGRLGGGALTSVRELRWGTPEPDEVPTLVDAELITREGPVRLAGPLVVRTGDASPGPSGPPGADRVRVLWRQRLRIERDRDLVCAGDLVEESGRWILRGTATAPLRAQAAWPCGTREPILLGRTIAAGLALAGCMSLALLGLGKAAQEELDSATEHYEPKPKVWRLVCDIALGCTPAPPPPRVWY